MRGPFSCMRTAYRFAMEWLYIACIVLAGLAMLAAAASSATASLPDAFGKWTGGASITITDTQLDEAAGQNAAVIREYGFLAGTRRDYSSGSNRATLTAWEMKDASGSLGLFTFLNVPGMKAEKFGDATGPLADL